MNIPDQPTAFTQMMQHNLRQQERGGLLSSQKADSNPSQNPLLQHANYEGAGLSQKIMTTEKNDWILSSGYSPEPRDYPIMVCWSDRPDFPPQIYLTEGKAMLATYSITHWKRYRDAGPAKEKEVTQEQKDNDAFYSSARGNVAWGASAAWAEALRYERSELRQLIKRHKEGELLAPEVIRMITERVKSR